MTAPLPAGARVMTPKGPGKVNYARLLPPDYATAASYSILLDASADHPHPSTQRSASAGRRQERALMYSNLVLAGVLILGDVLALAVFFYLYRRGHR